MAPAVDLAPYRCPPLRPADRATFAGAPARPPAGDLTVAATKRWIDALELPVEERTRAGWSVMCGYDQYHGQAAPKT